MMQTFSQWLQRKFVGTELGALTFSLIILTLLFWWLSNLIIPVLVSVVIAYLLSGIVKKLIRWKVPEILAILLVYILFLSLLVFSLLILLPMIWEQLSLLFSELPLKINKAQGYLMELSQRYPNYISQTQIHSWLNTFQSNFSAIGKNLLSFSVTTVSKIMMLVVYLILVPLMVYFFMKDRSVILAWFTRFLPRRRKLLAEVWQEIDQQMGHYISAKIIEVIILGIVATVIFLWLGLHYAVLLGVLVGLSALIPYVGVVLVTLPVVAVGYMQWGFDSSFVYLLIIYIILMIVDGNILIPLLFSETMNIHPVAVIIAILIFGGLWGFWGIFFAIPLASVTKVLLNAWLLQDHSEAR
jgi:putative permease